MITLRKVATQGFVWNLLMACILVSPPIHFKFPIASLISQLLGGSSHGRVVICDFIHRPMHLDSLLPFYARLPVRFPGFVSKLFGSVE